ncbi:MAG: metallophosphoesterase [Tepidisphaeraceae bacterium]
MNETPANLTPTIDVVRRGPTFQIGSTKRYGLTRIRLPIVGLPNDLAGLRLLHLGDTHLHADRWEPAFELAIDEIAQFKPDLICHSGDWIDDKFNHRPVMPVLKRFVEGLLPSARLGVWSCVGNHDGDLLAPHLIDLGVRVLLGETARFAVADGALELVGLPGVGRDDLTTDVVAGIVPKAPDTMRVVLCHFPDAIHKIVPLAPDIHLAGHTHGGQICWPGGKPLITHDSLPKETSAGLHRIENCWLHITRGLGWTGLPVRAWSCAEMTLIELVRA